MSDASPRRPLVLVAEDDGDIRTLIAHRLKAGGYDVVAAEDGPRALHLVDKAEPDLLPLDVSMPGLDGFAVCREVAKRGPSAPPVIFLTAHGHTFSRVTGLDAGAVDYVVNPFEAAELLARVRAALRTKAVQDELAALAATDPLTGLLKAASSTCAWPRRSPSRTATGGPSRRSSPTSTTSSASTTATGTPPATRCCARWRTGSAPRAASRTSSPATAAKNSSSSCPRRTARAR